MRFDALPFTLKGDCPIVDHESVAKSYLVSQNVTLQ